jgi:hypothetical protein
MSIRSFLRYYRSFLLFASMFYRMMGVSFVIATMTAKNYVS